MRILVDAMGGDLAPDEIVKGAVHAQQKLGAEIVLVGQRAAIEACLRNEQAKLEIIDASEVITMDDDPSTATRRKKDASMTVALNMLRDGKGDAVVSAGSTGALLTGATLIVKRIHGIRRAALAPVLPNGDAGVMLIDCGANADCTPEYLLQFAYMGSYYARTMLGIAAPRVGLLSNGTEDHKGSELQHETFPLLKAADAAGRIRFVGNVEASQVFSGDVDVVVTDGFTGNVLLKGIEGSIKYMTRQLKGIFMKTSRPRWLLLPSRTSSTRSRHRSTRTRSAARPCSASASRLSRPTAHLMRARSTMPSVRRSPLSIPASLTTSRPTSPICVWTGTRRRRATDGGAGGPPGLHVP